MPTADEEWFPLLDDRDRVVGRARRTDCHGHPGLRHPVVHARVFNRRGELLLQKRAAGKDVQPGRWDTSVGGHVLYGESVAAAVVREVREEIGIDARLDPAAPGPEIRYPGGAAPPDAAGARRVAGDAPTMTLRFVAAYAHSNDDETERVFVFDGVHDGPFARQAAEVDELRFWPADAPGRPENAARFTPNLIDEHRRLASGGTPDDGDPRQ